jgi:hypothetical protein
MNTCEHDGCIVVYDGNKRSCRACALTAENYQLIKQLHELRQKSAITACAEDLRLDTKTLATKWPLPRGRGGKVTFNRCGQRIRRGRK